MQIWERDKKISLRKTQQKKVINHALLQSQYVFRESMIFTHLLCCFFCEDNLLVTIKPASIYPSPGSFVRLVLFFFFKKSPVNSLSSLDEKLNFSVFVQIHPYAIFSLPDGIYHTESEQMHHDSMPVSWAKNWLNFLSDIIKSKDISCNRLVSNEWWFTDHPSSLVFFNDFGWKSKYLTFWLCIIVK